MKGKGPRQERETIINFNEAADTASIWTASETVYRRLRRLGYFPAEDNERSATFEISKKCVSVRKPKVLTEKQRAASLKGLQAARNALFRSGAPSETGVQQPNGPGKG